MADGSEHVIKLKPKREGEKSPEELAREQTEIIMKEYMEKIVKTGKAP